MKPYFYILVIISTSALLMDASLSYGGESGAHGGGGLVSRFTTIAQSIVKRLEIENIMEIHEVKVALLRDVVDHTPVVIVNSIKISGEPVAASVDDEGRQIDLNLSDYDRLMKEAWARGEKNFEETVVLHEYARVMYRKKMLKADDDQHQFSTPIVEELENNSKIDRHVLVILPGPHLTEMLAGPESKVTDLGTIYHLDIQGKNGKVQRIEDYRRGTIIVGGPVNMLPDIDLTLADKVAEQYNATFHLIAQYAPPKDFFLYLLANTTKVESPQFENGETITVTVSPERRKSIQNQVQACSRDICFVFIEIPDGS